MKVNPCKKKHALGTKIIRETILLLLLSSSTLLTQAQTTYNNEGFETANSETREDGKTIETYGIWIDGGSNAYAKTTERYSGGQSFAISKGDDPEKPFYGSIYTKTLDFSAATKGIVSFKYLITNSSGNLSPPGSFALEISNDGGESFRALKTFNLTTEPVIKTSASAWFANCKSKCLAFPPCVLSCEGSSTSLTNDDTRQYWSSYSAEFTGADLSKMTILRIKSYLSNTDAVTKIFIDELDIQYTGGSPDLSKNTIKVSSDTLSGSVKETLTQNFNSQNDWGIWQDGGRNVYLTNFFALDQNGQPHSENAYGVGMRNFFSGKHNGTINGLDMGYQKPDYSGITTKNLDLTDTQSLGLEFSFVSYNMKMNDPSLAELAASGDLHAVTIDGTTVDGYVPGPDHIKIMISTDSGYTYKTLKKLVYGVDFMNLKRQHLTVFIPGDFMATDGQDDPEAILNTAGFTTTTKIKIQCFSDTDAQQFYIDQLVLKKIGTATSPKGSARDLNWKGYKQTLLHADPEFMNGDTYELINSKLLDPLVYASRSFLLSDDDVVEEGGEEIPGTYGVVEFSDCSDHSTLTDVPWSEGDRHVTQDYDENLERYIFNFHSHLDEDTERCRTIKYDDRMRTEIKTKHDSGEDKKGIQGETHFFAWKMKLPEDFKGSNKFTHLHQIKPVGGEHAGMPTITLTANGEKVDPDTGLQYARPELRLRYAGLSESQVTVATIDLGLLKGKWIQFVEKVHFDTSDQGRYELLVYDPINGSIENPIFTFESYSLQTWKVGDDHSDATSDIFVRPKWGIYRSNVEAEKLGDEIVGFTDFMILEVTDREDGLYGDINSFAAYAETAVENIETTTEGIVDEIEATELFVNLDATTDGISGTKNDPFNLVKSAVDYINSDPLHHEQDFLITISGILTAPETFEVNSERSGILLFLMWDSDFDIEDATGALSSKYDVSEDTNTEDLMVAKISFEPGEDQNPYTIYSTGPLGGDTEGQCATSIANPTFLGYLDDDPLISTAVSLSAGLPFEENCPTPNITERVQENTPQSVQVLIKGDQVGSYLYILPASNDQAPETRYGWETYFHEGTQVSIDNVWVYRLLIKETNQLVQFIPSGSVIWIGTGVSEDTVDGDAAFGASKLSLSPNPSSHSVTLDIDHNGGGASYAIYTINGIQVYSGAISQENDTTSETVDISKLTSGLYIIKIKFEDGAEFNSKLMKR